jgi:BMFP domain-containing protein YqiC
MLDHNFFENLAKQFSNVIPPQLAALKQDLETNFYMVLQSFLSKYDLVTREEFDRQVKLLQKAREKIERLEDRLKLLENK